MSDVVDETARRSELEVEQCDGDTGTEDDVFRAHVVVAHERSTRRVGETVAPTEPVRVELARRVMQLAQQPGDGCQRGIGLAPFRIWRHGHVAVDEHQSFTSVAVDADWCRNSVESDALRGPQEGVNRSRVLCRRAKYVRTNANDVPRVRDSAVELLLVRHTPRMPDHDRRGECPIGSYGVGSNK